MPFKILPSVGRTVFFCNLKSQQNFGNSGTTERTRFMAQSTSKNETTLKKRLAELEKLQDFLPTHPYSIVLRLRLAKSYMDLGYSDLAVGDAYKALLLADELGEEGEFQEEVLSAALVDFRSKRALNFVQESHLSPGLDYSRCQCMRIFNIEAAAENNGHEVLTRAKECWSKTAYGILVGCLIDCGCLRSAFEYNTRALRAFPECYLFETYREGILLKLRAHFESKGENFNHSVDVSEYPDKGLVRREQYPWNEHEPDRFSDESLQILNDQMAEIAPKLEVKKTTLQILSPGASETENSERYIDQLGIFAKEDIAPGEKILEEKSLLTAVSRLRDTFCDACSIPLSKEGEGSSHQEVSVCDECDEAFFCSPACHALAQMKYHPALCGIDTDQKVPASEASDFLYSLLLVRALALAEVQELHPLELPEVRFIWGDYHGLDINQEWKVDAKSNLADPFGSVPRTLPFSFKDNVLTPLNILEKMDVNIFEQSHRYDTWIFNTLYAKFRGTASARQGRDGRPEVSAVHPMWCLGNHSCDPNVRWEWQGSIRFWTREKLVDWKGRSPDVKPGLRKGEELMGHYCDVSLPVKERREWAVGALGGDCMCPRCVWEAAEQKAESEGKGIEQLSIS